MIIDEDKIIANLTIEYFPLSNFVNMPYLVVNKKNRGKKLSKLLFEEAFKELEIKSKERQKMIYNNATDGRIPELMKFFNLSSSEEMWEIIKNFEPHYCLESEFENEFDPIMDPLDRLKIYDKIGFKIVDMDYILPPISDSLKPVHLYFLTATKFCLKDENGEFYIGSNNLKTFYWEFSHILSPLKYLNSEDFHQVINSISKGNVSLKMIKF